ncbi:MAG: glycosyltransferase family 61 protein [Verrucomicrobiota bacterium]
MPDVSTYYRLAFKLREIPALHRPLKWLRKLFWVELPAKWYGVLRALAPSKNFRLGPPVRTFTIFGSWAMDGIRPGRVVLTDQGAPKAGDDSILVKCGLNQHSVQPWPVFWSRHSQARLVSSSLALMDAQKRICWESVYGDHGLTGDPAWSYVRLPQPTKLAGNWTSVVSRWCPSTMVAPYSHWILDALPRLALLSDFPPDTGILVPGRLAGYQKESLRLLGLLDRCRCTPETHLLVENYYFSSPTAMISCHNPYGVGALRSAFMPKADTSYHGPKRFVIARRGKTRGIVNETEVYDYFRSIGWDIIDTEKLTFAQEIQLFAEAEAYAGVLGSGFTNAVWSSPGCKAITFVADNWVDGWVDWICQVNRLDYLWQLFPADAAMMATVDLDSIRKLLARAGLSPR